MIKPTLSSRQIKEIKNAVRQKTTPGLVVSIVLHLFIIGMGFITFPEFGKKKPVEVSISVDLLPISKVSNIKTKDNLTKKKVAKKIKKGKPKSAPKPKSHPVPKSKPKILPKKKVSSLKVKKKIDIHKKDVKKEKKQIKKKVNKIKEQENFDSLLKTLEEETAKKKVKINQKKKNEKAARGLYNKSKPLSISQIDDIRSQFTECWTTVSGGKDAGNLAVLLEISLEKDGTVKNIKLVHLNRYNSGDTFYRAAADAAIRAVKICSPIQNLPEDQYEAWKVMEFLFDPSQMIY
jgi:hypothetical protein